MIQLQLNGKTLGVVDVPERQRYFGLYSYGLVMKLMWNEMTTPAKFKQCEIILDPGQWSILGRLNDITEEQAAVFGKGDVTGFDAELFKINIRSHGIEGNPLIILKEKV